MSARDFHYYRLIESELHSARIKHPEFPTDLIHMVSIMNKEAGEAIRAALNHVYQFEDLQNVKNELYQTGAMVVRCLEQIEELENESFSFTDSVSIPCPECGAVVCGMECTEGRGPGAGGGGSLDSGYDELVKRITDKCVKIIEARISDEYLGLDDL